MPTLSIPPCPPGHELTFADVDGERRIVAVPVSAETLEARRRHRAEVDAATVRRRAIRARIFERDWRACLALSDARRAELAAARERAQASPGLCAELLAQAQRRGQSGIDWPEYFRNAGLT